MNYYNWEEWKCKHKHIWLDAYDGIWGGTEEDFSHRRRPHLRWKPEPREKRRNIGNPARRKDFLKNWRKCRKYINLNNPFSIAFNKYHQIQSHIIRWNPLEICIYNFTSTFTIFCRFSVVSNFQYSSVLSFLPFSRVRFSPQVGFRSTDSKILSNDWRQRWKELKNKTCCRCEAFRLL